ncbi:tRNA (adenosine(37)-N6)-threonylcarbamoyltransferase complex transferase subunit TsaD, partial [Candidatus Parcubacteria bacterium]|nr:tRNA (adenosine(37)-N6)-threonylcarbamoyltransferase complex transferase subunit TsaD [Candidatus Parcubacteria bacterium]
MIILAIETSCDDTCMALLEIKGQKMKIRNNIVSSQVKLHAKYGGIYPFLAKREHQKNLPLVFKKVIKGVDVAQIDFIAITKGPGLEPCLWTGINFAKKLAKELKKPLIPVNHIEAHILVNFIDSNLQKIFPAICLVVSGGHTQLILMKGIGKYKILGETRDDAAGECFDKTARILGL